MVILYQLFKETKLYPMISINKHQTILYGTVMHIESFTRLNLQYNNSSFGSIKYSTSLMCLNHQLLILICEK